MYRFIPRFALAAGVLLSAAFGTVGAQDTYTPNDCLFSIPAGATLDCGTLTVPQDRSQPDSRTITLPVAVFRTSAAQPAAEPMVFLQGGPGGGTLDIIPAIYTTLIAPITQERDVVLFDQRGTGLASPALDCPEVDTASIRDLEGVLGEAEALTLYTDAFRACSQRFAAEGVDVSAYTSRENASDVADLIVALGYSQAHLYGGSYGTRLAQTVLRDHPEVVRSLVLDSALTLEENLYEQQAFKTDFALNRLFAACQHDAGCAAAFPDLETAYYAAVDALTAAPVIVPVTNPATGETIQATVSGTDFSAVIFLSLQVPQFIPDIPQLITDVARGNTEGLAFPLTVSLASSSSISIGMFTSTNCYEEIYASTPDQMHALWQEYPKSADFAASAAFESPEALFSVCDAWGAKPFDALEIAPVTSDVPVLALAGELDPATPAVWTQRVAANFPNSHYYEFAGQTHVVATSNACAVSVIASFLSNPDTAPDATCVAEVPAATFNLPSDGVAESIPLTEYVDEDGWVGLVPDGWTMAQPGLFARGSSMSDTVSILQGILLEAGTGVVEQVATGIGLAEAPAHTETLTTALGDWAIYRLSAPTAEVDIALLQDDSNPAFILMQSTADEHDSLYNSVFLPAVDGFSLSQ